MSQIKRDISELEQLDSEIKRLSKQLRQLRVRRNMVEERIVNFLKEHDLPGVKHQEVAVVAQDRQKRPYKKKSQKYADGEYILRDYGIRNPGQALQEILEAMRGVPENKTHVKVRNIRSLR